ncbi:peptidyl-tRNA hydrolase [Synergistales bacterium]|nr:peptidyl-tRNA hydrolase [Synergistales bacterium]
MKLVAGLGNPGQEYAFTRHNMGWAVVDLIAGRHSLGSPVSKFRGEFWRDRDCLLLKPETFMNLSGLAVREAFDFYKMESADILIICDEMALPYGQLRLRAGGSAGGHNGLASVISCLGTLDVPRLRIGIGKSPSQDTQRQNTVNWVLGHLSKDEMEEFPGVLDKAAKGVEAWLTLDIDRAMSAVNVRKPSPPPSP